MLETALVKLLETGPIGAIAVICLYLYVQKDRQLQEAHDKYNSLMKEVIDAHKGLARQMVETIDQLQGLPKTYPQLDLFTESEKKE